MLQVEGYFVVPEQYAGPVPIAGISLIYEGIAGMVGKGAYCFDYGEGLRFMMFGFPIMDLANIVGREDRSFNSIGFSNPGLLLFSLVGKKPGQRLLSTCTPMSAAYQPEDRGKKTADGP